MRLSLKILVTIFSVMPSHTSWGKDPEVVVSPGRVRLDTPESTQQLLVTSGSGTRAIDLTRSVRYESADPEVASVDASGLIVPSAAGQTEIVIHHQGKQRAIEVEVADLASAKPVSFRHEIQPILIKAGCSSSGCHGKAEGQNGFKLSIFGFDPASDHEALVKEGRGRRVSIAAPAHSLLLRKGAALVPHGGGRKIEPNGFWFRRIERWIAEGARFESETATGVVALAIEPAEIVLRPKASQQIRVTAIDDRGAKHCVTVEAEYKTNSPEIASVDRNGLVQVSEIPGEAAVLVRYMGKVGVCRITLPQETKLSERPPENNFVDKHVWDKLERLGIAPSGLADDSTFLRRVFLDTIGTLPTRAEAERFLKDESADKRARLVDALLERGEYSDYWAMRWADILRVDQAIIGPQAAVAMTRWLKRQFARNTPIDDFVRAILTANGNTLAEGPVAFFQVHKDPEMLARSVGQLFLGVRIECAQCHHHPFERWSQKDYFAFAGFFTGVARKGMAGGTKVTATAGSDLKHPRTGQLVPASGLGAAAPDLEKTSDRRLPLADWMLSPSNPFFARSLANRLWSHFFGTGLVEPIDDLRATNPATNEPLLEALTNHLVEVGFDRKAFIRTLVNSRAYQLTSVPNESNRLDQQSYSHSAWRPLPAEVLLDAISQTTGVPEQFNGWPLGYRAIQVWDSRMPSYFFKVFGKPQRTTVCLCERGSEPSMAQVLHLMNSPELTAKIRHRSGRAAELAESALSETEIVQQLYLAALARYPSVDELALMKEAFVRSENRRLAVEDILWALLNTREFLYNH